MASPRSSSPISATHRARRGDHPRGSALAFAGNASVWRGCWPDSTPWRTRTTPPTPRRKNRVVRVGWSVLNSSCFVSSNPTQQRSMRSGLQFAPTAGFHHARQCRKPADECCATTRCRHHQMRLGLSTRSTKSRHRWLRKVCPAWFWLTDPSVGR